MKKMVLMPLLMLSLIILLTGCGQIDLSGSWVGEVTTTTGDCDPGTYPFSLVIVQNEENISGTLTYNGTDYELSGSVDGSDFTINGEEISEQPWQNVALSGIAADDSSASGTFLWTGDGMCFGSFTIERGEPQVG